MHVTTCSFAWLLFIFLSWFDMFICFTPFYFSIMQHVHLFDSFFCLVIKHVHFFDSLYLFSIMIQHVHRFYFHFSITIMFQNYHFILLFYIYVSLISIVSILFPNILSWFNFFFSFESLVICFIIFILLPCFMFEHVCWSTEWASGLSQVFC